jgi:hypothetical protein
MPRTMPTDLTARLELLAVAAETVHSRLQVRQRGKAGLPRGWCR